MAGLVLQLYLYDLFHQGFSQIQSLNAETFLASDEGHHRAENNQSDAVVTDWVQVVCGALEEYCDHSTAQTQGHCGR